MKPLVHVPNKRINAQALLPRTKVSLWQRYAPTMVLTHLFWLKNVLFLFLLLSLLGSFLLVILDPHTLPLTVVRIEGHLINTDQKDLQALVSQVVSGGFLNVDLAAVQRAVLTLPFLKDAQVQRQWPDTLLIQVQERQAVARWEDLALVDEQGNLFIGPPLREKGKGEIKQGSWGLPRFAGPLGSVGEVLKHYNRVYPLVQDAGLQIHEFGRNARSTWYMVLDNGMKLQLGRGDSDARVQRFLKVHRRMLTAQKSPPLHVDLRYTNGIAVQTALAE